MAKTARKKPATLPGTSQAANGSRDLADRLPVRWQTALVFAWAILVQGAALAANPLARLPVSVFFFGDGITYFEQARRLASGQELLNFGLPFHPPLVSWLLVPLWWIFGSAPAVSLAAKGLMIALSAATYAGFFHLVRRFLPGALWIALLLPLGFGELVLSSAISVEVVYRFLLVALLLLGWRFPLLAGLLHGAAVLARVEHLGLALVLAAVVALRLPDRRRWVATAVLGAALLLVPYSLAVHGTLAAYNRAHAGELAAPLPEWVPISFYGPLNFALAQREEGIHFSRLTLPPPPGEPAALDPTFPPHNEMIVHGYGLGLREIADRPGRFLARTLAKTGASLAALGFGWTWKDLPHPGPWTRQPVDVAAAEAPVYALLCGLLAVLGGWALRRERTFLAVGCGLLLFRLAVNAVFFPYLRGLLVVSPFLLALVLAGARRLAGRHGDRLLQALLAGLALFHFATVWTGQRYQLDGERGTDGAILDDRPVVIELEHSS